MAKKIFFNVYAPFNGLVANHDFAGKIISPPYDVLSREEAKILAKDNPYSFLRISRAEIDFPDSVSASEKIVYERAAENFKKLINNRSIIEDEKAAFYILKLQKDDHFQTGVISACSVLAYESGEVIRHEHTRPEKEDDRVKHLESLSAATGPTLLTYRRDPILSDLVTKLSLGIPIIDVHDIYKVRHTIWRICSENYVDELGLALNQIKKSYIADGHHRTAASYRLARDKKMTDGRFLAALFPSDQLLVLDYNRVVRDLNGLSSREFLSKLSTSFNVSVLETPAKPLLRGNFTLYMDGYWYSLSYRDKSRIKGEHPDNLDVSLLNYKILEPLLGIENLRTNPRVEFIGGARGLEGLKSFVDENHWAAAFALYPTSVDELMNIADTGEIMPPKSTWFEPKLADGLISLPLDFTN
ncbi:MAG: hypothetical protein CMM30_00860 [Rhodospirillaceae bacterium]|nr:hypothetical protein [Rhodospirillaceae bacterium]